MFLKNVEVMTILVRDVIKEPYNRVNGKSIWHNRQHMSSKNDY